MPHEYTGKIEQQQPSQGRGKEGGLAIDLEMSRLSIQDTGSLRNALKGGQIFSNRKADPSMFFTCSCIFHNANYGKGSIDSGYWIMVKDSPLATHPREAACMGMTVTIFPTYEEQWKSQSDTAKKSLFFENPHLIVIMPSLYCVLIS
jgi:hypothetical protein